MTEISFDEVVKLIEEKGINTEGFDTEELMVAAFLTGAAYCFDLLLEGAGDVKEEIKVGFKQRYNTDEEDYE